MEEMAGKNLGRYHIIEQLGHGGMANVYRAYDNRLEVDVAIKFLRPDVVTPEHRQEIHTRFEREARSLARLSFPNIVKVTDCGEYNGLPFFVMEYIPRGNLKRLMGKPIPYRVVAHMLAPIARALEYAHQNGIIHRDVKPANILIDKGGNLLITDFGTAKLLQPEDGISLTGSSASIGTPDYMAPEQIAAKFVDHRADIYALGITFYEMITGKRPFTADTPMAIMLKQVNEPVPKPSLSIQDLPANIEKALLKALAKDPKDRYQSMREFAEVLEKMGAGVDAMEVKKLVVGEDSRGEIFPTGADSHAIPGEKEQDRRANGKTRFATGLVALGMVLLGIVIGSVITQKFFTPPAPTLAPTAIAAVRLPSTTLTNTIAPTVAHTATPEPSDTVAPTPAAMVADIPVSIQVIANGKLSDLIIDPVHFPTGSVTSGGVQFPLPSGFNRAATEGNVLGYLGAPAEITLSTNEIANVEAVFLLINAGFTPGFNGKRIGKVELVFNDATINEDLILGNNIRDFAIGSKGAVGKTTGKNTTQAFTGESQGIGRYAFDMLKIPVTSEYRGKRLRSISIIDTSRQDVGSAKPNLFLIGLAIRANVPAGFQWTEPPGKPLAIMRFDLEKNYTAVYSAPRTSAQVVDQIALGGSWTVAGASKDGKWILIDLPKGDQGWAPLQYFEVSVDLSTLPVAETP